LRRLLSAANLAVCRGPPAGNRRSFRRARASGFEAIVRADGIRRRRALLPSSRWKTRVFIDGPVACYRARVCKSAKRPRARSNSMPRMRLALNEMGGAAIVQRLRRLRRSARPTNTV